MIASKWRYLCCLRHILFIAEKNPQMGTALVLILRDLNKKALTKNREGLLLYNDILLLVAFTAIGCVLH